MDQYCSHKTQRISSEVRNTVKNIKQSDEEAYSVEIVDETFQDQSDIMDFDQFLRKKDTSRATTAAKHLDPLEEEVILVDAKSRETESEKLNLLCKKIENQEKSLEGKLRKNELIEERNKLIATLLSKKTRNDVVDSIRKDRLIYHTNMKEFWAERLQLEKEKLKVKKRKNNLLEERNVLMKALLDQMKTKNFDDSHDISKKTAIEVYNIEDSDRRNKNEVVDIEKDIVEVDHTEELD